MEDILQSGFIVVAGIIMAIFLLTFTPYRKYATWLLFLGVMAIAGSAYYIHDQRQKAEIFVSNLRVDVVAGEPGCPSPPVSLNLVIHNQNELPAQKLDVLIEAMAADTGTSLYRFIHHVERNIPAGASLAVCEALTPGGALVPFDTMPANTQWRASAYLPPPPPDTNDPFLTGTAWFYFF